MPNDLVLKLLGKCDILFEDEVISSGLTMSTFTDYIVGIIDEAEKSNGLVYHTGSSIFDILLAVYIALSCIVYDEMTPEDLVRALNPGDIVIFENKRAKFLGLTSDNMAQVKYDAVKKGNKESTTVTMPPKSFYKLKPYYGPATALDGRGIRSNSKTKLDFLQAVFGKRKIDVAGIGKRSAILVCNRDFADSFVEKVKICYDGTRYISITDLMPISYFSEDKEYPFRGNPGKNKPVLKFTNKISIAREIVYTDEEKQVFAVCILGAKATKNGESELPDIINRRSIKKTLLSFSVENYDSCLYTAYPDAKMFACTKDMLLSYSIPTEPFGVLTRENEMLINNIINRDIVENNVDGIIDIDEYRSFRKKISSIRHLVQNDDLIDRFIIESYALLNYFSNVPFPLSRVDTARQTMYLECPSFREKINFLDGIAKQYTGFLSDCLYGIVLILESISCVIEFDNPKFWPLVNAIRNALNSRTVLVLVPKPYYVDIFKAMLPSYMYHNSNLHIKTIGALDSKGYYDVIISIGCLGTKNFSVFSIFSAPKIECLLYPHERPLFNYQKNIFIKREREINNRSELKFETSDTYEEERVIESDFVDDKATEDYIEEIAIKAALQAVSSASGGATTKADVIRVATTIGGETIFFTKYFTPYIFDGSQMTVTENNVRDIAAGDMLLFTKNSDQTKDIIDEIIMKIASSSEQIKEAFRKSKYWKSCLLAYKDTHHLSFQDLSDAMQEYGTPKHPVTLRTWLNPESRIIAPREEDSFYQIALICGDDEMLASPESFHGACNTIRSLRVKILKLIGQSIIKTYQQVPEEITFFSDIVKEELSVLSQIVQVDTIVDVSDIQVSVTYTNRPCVL